MIPELGLLSLIMALGVALIQAIVPLLGAIYRNPVWIRLARPAAYTQFVFMASAFLILTYSFIVSDFSVLYVANNSNTHMPLIYRIAAVWGAHEGSLLLWAMVLSIWTVAVALFSRNMPDDFVARVISVMGMITIGFLLFMLFTSNPFLRLFPVPAEGRDPADLVYGVCRFLRGIRLGSRGLDQRQTGFGLGPLGTAMDQCVLGFSDNRYCRR